MAEVKIYNSGVYMVVDTKDAQKFLDLGYVLVEVKEEPPIVKPTKRGRGK